MVRYYWKAIEVNGSTDRAEILFYVEYENFESTQAVAIHDEARQFVRDNLNANKVWTTERDYQAERDYLNKIG